MNKLNTDCLAKVAVTVLPLQRHWNLQKTNLTSQTWS